MMGAMEALDEVKDKMPEDAYLMLCDASKEKYARLTREESNPSSVRGFYNPSFLQQSITSITIPPSVREIGVLSLIHI